jgi:hypothetical protein
MEAIAGRTRLGVAGALVVLIAALGLSLISARASATNYYWGCGTSTPPNTWCTSPNTHTYGEAVMDQYQAPIAWYCAKLTKPTDYGYYYARRCDWASQVLVWSDGGGLAPYPNNSVSMRAHVANGDNPYALMIHGAASY